ncbi:hypothetical protein ABKV19_002556 [Rosa sericea]
MRDVSLFLLKNSLGSKMKKGLRNFCNDDGSTSTLNQHGSSRPSPLGLALSQPDHDHTSPVGPVNVDSGFNKHWQNADDHQYRLQEMERQPTLEEMILKLDLEEEIARKSKALQLMKEGHEDDDYNVDMNGLIMRGPGRMSCVNNSDILRSARNALNQYPRFSLDGRDAMYRSSFRNNLHLQQDHIGIVGQEKLRPTHRDHRRSSDVCSSMGRDASSSTTRSLYRRLLPATLAGESVVWCKPGVVAKLMGLDAMPVPAVSVSGKFKGSSNEKLCYILKQSQRNMITMRSRGEQRHEMEKRSMMHAMDRSIPAARNCSRFNNCKKGKAAATTTTGSCSTTSKTTPAGNYCVVKPLVTIQHSDHN